MATRKCPMCKGKGGYDSRWGWCPDCKGTGKQHQEKKWVAG